MCHEVSRELWALIDEVQRRGLREAPLPGIAPDQPIQLVAPLTPEQSRAADAADAARFEIDKKIKALVPVSTCERPFTLHLRRHLDRDRDGVEGVEHRFGNAYCRKHTCAFCWRQRLMRTIKRAAVSILDEDDETDTERRLARVKAVYVVETTWQQWAAIDRAMRRELPRRAGRLRVRRGDDSVLVASAAPFAGGLALSPAAAALRVAEAIEHLHRRKHSYRQLGTWNDRKPSAWKLVSRLPALDRAMVDDLVRAIGGKGHAMKKIVGLVFRCPAQNGMVEQLRLDRQTEEDADGGDEDRLRQRLARPLEDRATVRAKAQAVREANHIAATVEETLLKSLDVSEENCNRRYFSPADETAEGGFDPTAPPWG